MPNMPDNYSIAELPYKIAVLCYLYDENDRLLLLHRNKEPNKNKYSPIGGKLEASIGESPHACAIREIHEESGVLVKSSDIRLSGMLAETAFAGKTHWLIFLYEVTRTVQVSEITSMDINEGTLEWVPIDEIENKDIPNTDRDIIWPLVKQHRGGFFALDIDCSKEPYSWEVKEEWKATDV